jgi:hypothetical protein
MILQEYFEAIKFQNAIKNVKVEKNVSKNCVVTREVRGLAQKNIHYAKQPVESLNDF